MPRRRASFLDKNIGAAIQAGTQIAQALFDVRRMRWEFALRKAKLAKEERERLDERAFQREVAAQKRKQKLLDLAETRRLAAEEERREEQRELEKSIVTQQGRGVIFDPQRVQQARAEESFGPLTAQGATRPRPRVPRVALTQEEKDKGKLFGLTDQQIIDDIKQFARTITRIPAHQDPTTQQFIPEQIKTEPGLKGQGSISLITSRLKNAGLTDFDIKRLKLSKSDIVDKVRQFDNMKVRGRGIRGRPQIIFSDQEIVGFIKAGVDVSTAGKLKLGGLQQQRQPTQQIQPTGAPRQQQDDRDALLNAKDATTGRSLYTPEEVEKLLLDKYGSPQNRPGG